jgi:hypothetical protein
MKINYKIGESEKVNIQQSAQSSFPQCMQYINLRINLGKQRSGEPAKQKRKFGLAYGIFLDD